MNPAFLFPATLQRSKPPGSRKKTLILPLTWQLTIILTIIPSYWLRFCQKELSASWPMTHRHIFSEIIRSGTEHEHWKQVTIIILFVAKLGSEWLKLGHFSVLQMFVGIRDTPVWNRWVGTSSHRWKYSPNSRGKRNAYTDKCQHCIVTKYLSCCFEISWNEHVCNVMGVRAWINVRQTSLLNRCPRIFSSNSIFGYQILNMLIQSIYAVDLLHGALYFHWLPSHPLIWTSCSLEYWIQRVKKEGRLMCGGFGQKWLKVSE